MHYIHTIAAIHLINVSHLKHTNIYMHTKLYVSLNPIYFSTTMFIFAKWFTVKKEIIEIHLNDSSDNYSAPCNERAATPSWVPLLLLLRLSHTENEVPKWVRVFLLPKTTVTNLKFNAILILQSLENHHPINKFITLKNVYSSSILIKLQFNSWYLQNKLQHATAYW